VKGLSQHNKLQEARLRGFFSTSPFQGGGLVGVNYRQGLTRALQGDVLQATFHLAQAAPCKAACGHRRLSAHLRELLLKFAPTKADTFSLWLYSFERNEVTFASLPLHPVFSDRKGKMLLISISPL